VDAILSDFQQWIDATPFQQVLAIEAVSLDRKVGRTKMRLPYNAKFARRYAAHEFHGGVIATLIDISGASALFAARGYAGPTIDMRIDYLRLGSGSNLTADANLIKDGRSLALADVSISDDRGQPVAVGRVALSTLKMHVAGESTLPQKR
jgi:uncharacterized protein (TIGR00369 family)